MTAWTSEWIPLFVLPNLLVKEPVEVEFVALVAPNDPRCVKIGKANPNFTKFLRSFTDAFKRKVIPSALIVRVDAPPWIMSMEAIGGFRDAISISAVVHNRTNTILYGHAKSHQYSSFFDFYAWVFSKDFNLLTTNNPALLGMDEFKDFRGQSTAGLPASQWEGLDYDETLLKALFGEWPRRFSAPVPAWRSVALFRSLNMAHAAAQVPALVDVTSQSLGRSVALWISAFEILTHPRDGDGGLKEVYRVFENVDWRTEACREQIHDCYEGRTRRPHARKRNLACWIYGELYHARNDYLHGNALADDRLVVKTSGRSLFMFTQSLYRLLLTGFLGIDYYGPFKPRDSAESLYGDIQGIMNFRFENRQGDHERALAKILQPPDKRT
jgi:hypothetical protein